MLLLLPLIAAVDVNTLVVIVDVNRPNYTQCPKLLELAQTVVILDHHRQSGEAIDNAVLSYIEPYASSACEMVAEILQYIGEGLRLKQFCKCIIFHKNFCWSNWLCFTHIFIHFRSKHLTNFCNVCTISTVILLEDVKSLGKKGDVVKVSDGYARNYILPKKMGLEATQKNLNDLKLQKAAEERRQKEIYEEAKQLAEKALSAL